MQDKEDSAYEEPNTINQLQSVTINQIQYLGQYTLWQDESAKMNCWSTVIL